ncbi:MAG TPA: hypothetical protein VMG13_01270 [Trebonia sp.]|nr:hypothetical protein [Trebonia sp.]
MTATRHTLASQALRALRHVNDEFLLASEAIIRSGRAPADSRPGAAGPPPRTRPRRGFPHPGRVTDRADRVA